MKRIGGVLLLLLVAPLAAALDVRVGPFFEVKGITRTNGQVVLPLERRKYSNLRLLDKSTRDFISACTEPCVQSAARVDVSVMDVRPAQTRPGMWIASVAFNRAWLVTFLVFQHGEHYTSKPPAGFVFLDATLRTQTEELLQRAVVELK